MIFGVGIQAIKDLDIESTQQKQKINNLETRLNELESQIQNILSSVNL